MTNIEDVYIVCPGLEHSPYSLSVLERAEILDRAPDLSPRLTDACRPISAHAPVVVPSRPFHTARLGRCYGNVELLVGTCVGRLVSGWALWEDSGLTLNCEHHAVWRTPDGELLCVTPQLNGEKEIVFVLQKEWEEIPSEDKFLPCVQTHFLPLTDHPRVRTVCELLSRSARYAQGSAQHRALRDRAVALRDRFLRQVAERSRRRERRRRGQKG